eukprot:3609229-Amphidinium_carterae.1
MRVRAAITQCHCILRDFIPMLAKSFRTCCRSDPASVAKVLSNTRPTNFKTMLPSSSFAEVLQTQIS